MPLALPLRQVHLDFHTSPYIPDVASEFDADAFAATFEAARVTSVTIFAKCHHGMCYYPTKTGTMHPALHRRDLLGEQIEALHRLGIRCPLYTTVAWEEDAAQKHPAWRQMDKQGNFARVNGGVDNKTRQPGGWHFNDFIHPDYQDYIEAHIRELLSYDVDGLFFDIVFYDDDACWSDASLAFRAKHGLLADEPMLHARFEALAQAQFGDRFTRLVRDAKPEATVFYNTTTYPSLSYHGAPLGLRAREPSMTHFEVESLPSGFWGYHHFPRLARQVMQGSKPWLGMTGRFQKMWGDFGGIKPQAALEYECFRSQALGGGNSVGDQLPPRGTPDAAAYRLIGSVYTLCEEADPFYAGSQGLPQIGVVLPHYAGRDRNAADKSLEGALQMCEEAHYDAAVVDDADDFASYDLLILPDATVVAPPLQEKLAEYHRRGGTLLLSFQAGMNEDGVWSLPFLPLEVQGPVEKWPTYWRAAASFDADLAISDRVFYERGLNVTGSGTQTLVERVLPYFQRTDLHFSSHFQTPPVAEADPFPAVLAGERVVYFADPIFREYRQTGNIAARDGWKQATARLIGPAPFGDGLPTTVLSVPRRRGADLLLTLLHYVPVRKALDIDVIEERMSFAGETLRLPSSVESVRVFGTQTALTQAGPGEFLLPAQRGRLLLECPDFFAPETS